MVYTPEVIESLLPHQIIVFGSNNQGRHGKGLALLCRKKFGAIYGQAKGLQGQCYAIITKDLRIGKRSISLKEIKTQLEEFIIFATLNPDKEFLMTKIGTNHAGYTEQEISNIFSSLNFPHNVRLPKFIKSHLDQWFEILDI